MGMFELEGRRALVTGGAKGIGAAIVRALGEAGVRVAVADLDVAAARTLAEEIGGDALAVEIDVRHRVSVEKAINAGIDWLGGLDILVANAGVSTMRRAVDLTDDDWDFNMDVNARGVFLANQIACRHFLATGTKGVIVNTASLAGKVGAPLLAHYSASKFAVLGWTQALAREMAPARHPRERRLPGLREDLDAGARDRLGGRASRHDAGGGPRRIRVADAARPHRGAGGRGEGRALPCLRRLRLHDGAGDQRHRRRQDGLKMKLTSHGRYDYVPIAGRPVYDWPNGKRLAVYLGLNLEHFSFGEGLGAELAPSAQPDVLNYAWRDYGNRVGAWRLLELFDAQRWPPPCSSTPRCTTMRRSLSRRSASAATRSSATAAPIPSGRALSTRRVSAR